MKFYLESVENTFKEVSSDPHGLSAQEAEARLQKYGKNKLAEGKKVTLLQRFLEQLSDPMLIILMVAAVVSGITNYLSGRIYHHVRCYFELGAGRYSGKQS